MGTAKRGHKKGLSAGFRKLRKAEDESLEIYEICSSGLDGSVPFRSVCFWVSGAKAEGCPLLSHTWGQVIATDPSTGKTAPWQRFRITSRKVA